jgi:hypothetical protein
MTNALLRALPGPNVIQVLFLEDFLLAWYLSVVWNNESNRTGLSVWDEQSN